MLKAKDVGVANMTKQKDLGSMSELSEIPHSKEPCGTPKTLEMAIQNGFEMSLRNPNSVAENIHLTVKDFMANKFTKAYMRIDKRRKGQTTDDCEKIIKDLYEELTRRSA